MLADLLVRKPLNCLICVEFFGFIIVSYGPCVGFRICSGLGRSLWSRCLCVDYVDKKRLGVV